MFSKILIPIDLSNDDNSVAIIETANKLGNIKEVILLHVLEKIPEQVLEEFSEELDNDDVSEAKTELNLILSRANIANNIVKVVVRKGGSCDTIINVSEEFSIDLILLDSSKKGLEKYILGSTATKVVKLAKCSVLVKR